VQAPLATGEGERKTRDEDPGAPHVCTSRIVKGVSV
jgi:hypothetical protein